MHRRTKLILGLTTTGLLLLGFGLFWRSRGDGLEVHIGLSSYSVIEGQLHASLGLTNAGRSTAVVEFDFECSVTTTEGQTNYMVGERPALYMEVPPELSLNLNDPEHFMIPLPENALRWKVSLSARHRTTKEYVRSLVVESGALTLDELYNNRRRYALLLEEKRVVNGWKKITTSWIDIQPNIGSIAQPDASPEPPPRTASLEAHD